MNKNFDEILKKGKERVNITKNKGKKELFKEYVVNLINIIHKFNDVYDNDQHNILVSSANCNVCKKPTFIITVKSIENNQQSIRFHKSNWKAMGQGNYHCEKCKKV
jgi:superoxide dismutase